MAKLLYLVHRVPYPPNKGDKVRSYHLLRHLAAQHEVHLGTFVDDPEDEAHVDTLRQWCADLCCVRLHPARAKVASLTGLLTGQPLTLCYYRNRELQGWVDRALATNDFQAAVVFSSSMAQYVDRRPGLRVLADLVDVDSAKWAQYAGEHRWPMSWLYRREGRTLLDYERQVVRGASRSFLVTNQELTLFQSLSPDVGSRVEVMCNGVDADVFAPDAGRGTPFSSQELPLVFTGAMDYWPNIDAVRWFVHEMLPALRERWPALRFYIVGRSPATGVLDLAGAAVTVTGTVPDVRPYLQHAAVVVAPLRLARGVQNKVLEAMAMSRPVVAASTCVQAIDGRDGHELLAADAPNEYVAAINALLSDPDRAVAIGRAGRARVLDSFSWHAHLCAVDRCLSGAPGEAVA